MMQLDDVVSSVADDDARFAEAMDRSVRWLDRCIKVGRWVRHVEIEGREGGAGCVVAPTKCPMLVHGIFV
jgi:hypothetical protein